MGIKEVIAQIGRGAINVVTGRDKPVRPQNFRTEMYDAAQRDYRNISNKTRNVTRVLRRPVSSKFISKSGVPQRFDTGRYNPNKNIRFRKMLAKRQMQRNMMQNGQNNYNRGNIRPVGEVKEHNQYLNPIQTGGMRLWANDVPIAGKMMPINSQGLDINTKLVNNPPVNQPQSEYYVENDLLTGKPILKKRW